MAFTPVQGRYYHIIARHSGKALDVTGASQGNGANLIQWPRHGGPNQQFSFEPADANHYFIVARHSGQLLDVTGGSTSGGAAVIQWPRHGGPNQQFRLEELGDGNVRIVARHSGLALDINGGSTADGAQVIQWSAHGGPNQSFSVVAVASETAVAGDLYNTMAIEPASDYGFRVGTTFTQRFQAAITSIPTELAVRMGSNQNPYRARVTIKVNDVERFSHDFFDLKQRTSDWATVFPILGFPVTVRAGDWVSFSITPDRDTGIAALKINDPRCPPGTLDGYGAMTSRFYMRGATAAQGGTYPVEQVDPKVIRSTMGSGGSNYALNAGATFTQTFTATGSGTPRELGVVFGNNQNLFGCRVTVTVRGAKVFEQTYQGCKQRQSDWATVFALDGLTASIQRGDQVSFTVSPDTHVGFSAVHVNEVGLVKGSLPGYGECSSQFYLKA